MNEDWTPVLALGTLLTAVFTALGTLRTISTLEALVRKEDAVCPNCGQLFNITRFPVVDETLTVTCPRCGETFIAS